MKKTFLKTLMILGALTPVLGWAEMAYFNCYAGDQKLPAGTYGNIEMGLSAYATKVSANTQLPTTGEAGQVDGSFAQAIVNAGGDTDTQTHTFMGWFKVEDLSSDRYLWWGIGGETTNEHAGYAVQQTSDGKLKIGKISASDGNPSAWVDSLVTTNAVFEANTWVHIAIAITKTDGARTATPVVYVNGEESAIASGTFATNLNGNGGDATTFYVGAGVSVAGLYLDTTALSAEEIQALAVRVDYLTIAPTPVYLLDVGKETTTNIGSDTWVDHTQDQGGSITPTTEAYTVTVTTTSAGNFYSNNNSPADDFTSGTYLGLDGVTYDSVLGEMAATLGLSTTTIDASIYKDGLTNGGQRDHTVTIAGLDVNTTYVLYYIGGANKDSQPVAGFTLASYGGTPKVDYVVTSAGTATTVATSYQRVGATTAMRAGTTGYLLVRVSYVKPTEEGKITFTLSGERANINALAVAAINPVVSAVYTRELQDATENWSTADEWTDGVLPTKNDKVTLNVTSTTGSTLTIDAEAEVESLTIAGDYDFTATGEYTLTSGATIVNTNADFSAVTASLGDVDVAADKSLTVKTSADIASFKGADATSSLHLTEETGTFTLRPTPEETKVYIDGGTLKLGYPAWTNQFVVGSATLDFNGYANYRNSGAATAPLITLNDGATLKTSTGIGSDQAVMNALALGESVTASITGANFRVIAPGYGKTALALNSGTLQVNLDAGNVLDFSSMSVVKSPDEIAAALADASAETSEAGKIQVLSGELLLRSNRADLSRAEVSLEPASGKTAILKCDIDASVGALSGTGGTVRLIGNVTVGALNKDTTFAGVIEGQKNLNKVGTGTLTLAGDNTFTGTLNINDGAIAYKTKNVTPSYSIAGTGAIVVDGVTLDLTNATVADTLTAYTVKNNGALTLGTKRAANATLVVTDGGTINITATEAEVTSKAIIIAKYTETTLPTVNLTVPEGLTAPAWTLMVKAGFLQYSTSTEITEHTWSPTADGGGMWSDGFKDFTTGDNVKFTDAASVKTVNLDGTYATGKVTIASGDYTLWSPEGHPLSTSELVVASGASLTLFDQHIGVATVPMVIEATTATVNGTLTNSGTIDGDVTFGDSASIAATATGPLTITGSITLPTGGLTVTIPEETTAASLPLLSTTDETLTLTSSNANYTITYVDGVYTAISANSILHATITGPTAWDAITWYNAANTVVSNPNFTDGTTAISLTVNAAATITMSGDVTVKSMTLTGDSLLAFAIPSGKTFTTNHVIGGNMAITGAGTLKALGTSQGPTLDTVVLTLDGGNLALNGANGGGTIDPILNNVTLTYVSGTISASNWIKVKGIITLNSNTAFNYTEKPMAGVDGETASVKIGGTGTVCFNNHTNLNVEVLADATYIPMSGQTIAGVISGAGKVSVGAGTAPILSATNTYTGGTLVPAGTTLQVTSMANLGTSGAVTIEEGGRLEFRHAGNMSTGHDADWTRLTGTGTVVFSSTNNGYRLFPIATKPIAKTLTIENNLTNGLILPESGKTYEIGSVSGSGAFRWDYGTQGQASKLRITQSKNTNFTGAFTYGSDNRLDEYILAGEGDTRTLTFSGDTKTVAKLFTIEESGVLNLTGAWAGNVVVSGVVGGSGTIGGTLTIADAGFIALKNNQALTVTGAVTLPTNVLKVTMETFAAKDFKVLNATTFSNATLPTASIYVNGTEALANVALEARTDGLYLLLSETFTRTFDGSLTTWNKAGAWTISGTTETAAEPLAESKAQVTVNETTEVTATAPIHLSSLDILGEGVLNLNFDLSKMLDEDDYLATPYRATLFTVNEGFDAEKVIVYATGQRYSATASLMVTSTSVVLTLTLPDEMIEERDILSVNFASGRGTATHLVDEPTGYTGIEVPVASWAQPTGTGESLSSKDLILHAHDGTTTTLVGALTSVTSGAPYSVNPGDMDATLALFRGYLDDQNAPTISIDVPDDWSSYTAYIYCMTDGTDATFASKTVNGTDYTYVNGVLAQGISAWGNSSTSRGAFIEGVNTMIVSGLTGDFTIVSAKRNGARGCIAGIQLVQQPTYNLDKAPLIYTATLTTEDATWSTIEWTKPENATAERPSATDYTEITLANDVTLDVTNIATKQLSIFGRGHRLELLNVDVEDETPWSFDANTTLQLVDETSLLPKNIRNYPGRMLYTDHYEGEASTFANCTTEFAAGFTGTLTRAASSTAEFSGGTASITLTQSQTGTIVFSGNVHVTRMASADRNNYFSVGNYEVLLKDNATVVSEHFIMSEDYAGYVSVLTMEDNAAIQVTGSTNVNSNQASIMIGHWDGPSTLTIRDNARFVAERADMLMGLTRNNQTINLEGGELRVRGIMLAGNASGTNTLNLIAGKLLLGAGGIGRYPSSHRLVMNIEAATLGAYEPMTIGADLAAMTDLTGKPHFVGEDTITLTTPFLLGETVQVTGGGLALDGSAFTETYNLDLEDTTLYVRGGLDLQTATISLTNATISFDGGHVTTQAVVLNDTNSMLEIPLVGLLSQTGYMKFTTGATISDLSDLGVRLVLPVNRGETDRFLPVMPVVLGTSNEATASPRTPTIRNNTNNAVTGVTITFVEEGSLGSGYYAFIEGLEAMNAYTFELNATTAQELQQTRASNYPYHVLQGSATEGNLLTIVEGGVALYQADFIGGDIVVTAQGEVPHTLLHSNGITIGTNVTFDLTAWEAALETALIGVVKDVPLSYCLVSGGMNIAAGMTCSVTTGIDEQTLDTMGIEESIVTTANGIYLVYTTETRRAQTLSINYADASTPLVAPPNTVGAYAIDIAEWNTLQNSFSTPELYLTDRAGGKVGRAMRGDVATRLVTSTTYTRIDKTNPSLLQVWPSDTTAVTLTIENVPFEHYRVALIYSADIANAAFACAEVNGVSYAMDEAGYMRVEVRDFLETNANGSVKIFVAGDTAWGQTKIASTADADILGVNTLVTDVFTTTDEANTAVITLPALTYAKVYSGIAALQLIEAPTPPPTTSKNYSYTFTEAGEYTLDTLPLTVEGNAETETWVSAVAHNLTLSVADNVTDPVKVMLPIDFVAQTVTLNGATMELTTAGKSLALLSTLDVNGVGELTLSAPFDVENAVTIPADTKVVLSEDSGLTTNIDHASPLLSIDLASAGELRINYPVAVTRSVNAPDLTVSFRSHTSTATNNSAYHWLVEADDTITHSSKFHIASANDWAYVQRGGTASFTNAQGNEGGLLLFNDNSGEGLTATVDVSGGTLTATQISAWKTGSTVTVTVSNTGILTLGGNGLYARQANNAVSATVREGGTLVLNAATVSATGNGTKTLTFGSAANDATTLSTTLASATLAIPTTFTGATTIDIPATSTLVLNQQNNGSGTLTLNRGTFATTHVGALGGATLTVGEGATYEMRNLAADAAVTGTVSFASGAIIKIVNTAITTGDVKIAGVIENAEGATLIVNDAVKTFTVKDAATGTITITGDASADPSALTWQATQAEGVWMVGVAAPWTPETPFKNGDSVTFPVKDTSIDAINVKVLGNVAPATMTFAEGVSNTDNYTFTTDDVAVIDLTALEPVENKINLALGSGVTFDVPIKTDATSASSQIILKGVANTYRLIGTLDDTRTIASLWVEGENLNLADKHGVWAAADCNEVTLAPHAGEVQLLSAGGNELAGPTNVVITGGGTVRFPGHVGGTNWNGGFSGTFSIKDHAMLDFSFTREAAQYANPYFRANGSPFWWKEKPEDEDVVGFTLTNGATLRFSAAPGVIAGNAYINDARLVTNHPILLGTASTVSYETQHGDNANVTPYGHTFNGDGATLRATSETRLAAGSSLLVAGIGDKGDLTDPKTNTAVDTEGIPEDADLYGRLEAGIRASIEGTIAVAPSTVGNALICDVREGSTLAWNCDVTAPTNDTMSAPQFLKVGSGRLSLERDVEDLPLTIDLDEGTVGGLTTFTNPSSEINVAAGATIEAGLAFGTLVMNEAVTDDDDVTHYATMAIDPTGATLLKVNTAIFTDYKTYKVEALPGIEIPKARLQLPIQVVSWTTAQGANTSAFTLSEKLVKAGYAMMVKEDGLYLAKKVIYRRVETMTNLNASLMTRTWYDGAVWDRSEDNGVTWTENVTYAPVEGEAIVVQWVLPEKVNPGITMELMLSKATAFSEIVAMTQAEDGTLTAIAPKIVYNYDLSGEVMPEDDEVKIYTWVPTLVVGNTTTPASVKASGYSETCQVAIEMARVMLYSGSSTPAINISFGGARDGEASWMNETSLPCGVVEFPGAYWNNASINDSAKIFAGTTGACYSTGIRPAGVEGAEELNLIYAAVGANTQLSRANTTNGALTATYLTPGTLSDDVAGQFTANGVKSGWIMKLDAVPFYTYDLYILFAGAQDNANTTNPAVRVKVGTGAWRTYSYINDWTAPAATGDTWTGLASPVGNALVHGKHYLHIRVSTNESLGGLEIASVSNGSVNAGLAAIQIVECADGPVLKANASGAWSNATIWTREDKDGSTRSNGAWINATTANPRSALLPQNITMSVDMPAVMAYLTMGGATTLKGTPNYLDLASIDLTGASASTISFEDNVFVRSPKVIMDDNLTVHVPEVENGETINDWSWVFNPDVTASTVTLEKQRAGNLVLASSFAGAWNILDGALITNFAGYHASPVRGPGILIKRGAGTLELSGALSVSDEKTATPIRVEEGQLTLNTSNGLSGIGTGKTVLVSGGTLDIASGKSYAENTTLEATTGGRIIVHHAYSSTRANVLLKNGGTLMRNDGAAAYSGYHFTGVTAEGPGNVLQVNGGDYGGGGITLFEGITVKAGGSLLVPQNNSAGIRVLNATITVEDGATLTTRVAVGIGAAGDYGPLPDSRPMYKEGNGVWIIERMLGAKTDSPGGNKLIVNGGEVRIPFGGGAYEPADGHNGDITLNAGTRLSGNVAIGGRAPITVESGATIVNGVPGVVESSVKVHTLNLKNGAKFEFDLSKTQPLAVTDTLTVETGAEFVVTLTNLSSYKGGDKVLMTWPAGQTFVTANKLTSAEVVALDATFVIENNSLILRTANAAYTRSEGGDWSDALWSQPPDYTAQGTIPNASTTMARVEAAASLDLNVDSGAMGNITKWSAESLVLSSAANQNLTLVEGKTEGEEGTPVSLSVGALWKLGTGNARIEAPLAMVNGGDTFQVAEGRLTLANTVTPEATQSSYTSLQVPVVIAKYALLAVENSTLPATLEGDGTFRAEGTVTLGVTNLEGEDHNVNFSIADNAALTILTHTKESSRTATRTIDLGENATLTLRTRQATALGSTPNMVLNLKKGAVVNEDTVITNGIRFAGEINLAANIDPTVVGSATLNGDYQVPGDLAFDVGSNTQLMLNGNWTYANDTALAITKHGTGTLAMTGSMDPGNATVDLNEGTTILTDTTVASTGSATHWTVAPAAALQLGGATNITLQSGALTLQPNATLALATGTINVAGRTILERDSVVRIISENGKISTALNVNNLTVNGTIIIDLGDADPAQQVSASIPLITLNDGVIMGGGTFRLGGSSVTQWIEAGWSLRQTANAISLVSSTVGAYTWYGQGDTTAWSGANWYTGTELGEWPENEEVYASAVFADTIEVAQEDELGNTDLVSVIPSRSVTWDYPARDFIVRSLSFAAKAETGDGYTLRDGAGDTMTIMGELITSGDGGVTFETPVSLYTDASMTLLKGTTRFNGGLQSGATLTRPIAMGTEATLAFGGSKNVSLNTPFTVLSDEEEDKMGTIQHEGAGRLTLLSDLSQLSALTATTNGTIALEQENLYALVPQVSLAKAATLSFGGTYASVLPTGEDGVIALAINGQATDTVGGRLEWNTTGSASSTAAPRLSATKTKANVDTFVYRPKAGSLVVEPDGVFPETTALDLPNVADETQTLYIGAGQNTATPALTFSKITGTGIIGVEPKLNPALPTWSTKRILTLKMTEAAHTFAGRFTGATTESGIITLGIDLHRADTLEAGIVPRFSYGETSSNNLGTFTIDPNTNFEVLGAWEGNVDVKAGGLLSGNGAVGAEGKAVVVPAGAILSASRYDASAGTNLPSTLTIKGDLQLEADSKLDVIVHLDSKGQPVASCVQATSITLPEQTDNLNNEILLDVNVTITDDSISASGLKILGWGGINGIQNVNGTLTVNGQTEDHGYYLRQESDGLYLTRTTGRCILILQ